MGAVSGSGNLFVVTGPSGSGKDEIIRLLSRQGVEVRTAITALTRSPRPGEEHGVNHYFISPEEFERWKAEGMFLEWAQVYGRSYGTPRWEVDEPLKRGDDVLLRVDVQGARSVRRAYPQAVLIFIAPPSVDEARRRLRQRHTEGGAEQQARLEAFDGELAFSRKCDFVVVNQTGQQEAAAAEVAAILAKVRAARGSRQGPE